MNIDIAVTGIMSREPACLAANSRISDAWRLLSGGRIHHVPVVEAGRLVGMISPLDLAKLGACPVQDGAMLAEHFLDSRLSVGQLMCRDVISVRDNATVREAARLLSAGGFHSLPVVNAGHRVVGIVTTTDLIACLLDVPPVPAPRQPPSAAGGRVRNLARRARCRGGLPALRSRRARARAAGACRRSGARAGTRRPVALHALRALRAAGPLTEAMHRAVMPPARPARPRCRS